VCGMRTESERPAWVVPDALNRRRSSAAEPFGQETSRKGRWCNNKSGRNIFLGGDGIYTNRYYEPRLKKLHDISVEQKHIDCNG